MDSECLDAVASAFPAHAAEAEIRAADQVARTYPFRVPEHYLRLIDWSDADDPLRRVVVPCGDELQEDGEGLDTYDEDGYTQFPGLQHKYPDTVLLLVSSKCPGICRFCFRKRLFVSGESAEVVDMNEARAYILAHPEITNVLLSGGDALWLPTRRIAEILENLSGIGHLRFLRIGTRVPAWMPRRITEDPELLSVLREHCRSQRRMYAVLHFCHAREITDESREAIALLQEAGLSMVQQTAMIRGVNDSPEALAELWRTLAGIGVQPYYVFQCSVTRGNRAYCVPIEEAVAIFTQAQERCAGLTRTARFVISHATGKIEVLGKADGRTWFRYHRAADPIDNFRLFSKPSCPTAKWPDEYPNED